MIIPFLVVAAKLVAAWASVMAVLLLISKTLD